MNQTLASSLEAIAHAIAAVALQFAAASIKNPAHQAMAQPYLDIASSLLPLVNTAADTAIQGAVK